MSRDIFIAPPGRVLVQGDLSQAELRFVASLSGDEEMARIFHEGHDFHIATARLIAERVWGIQPDMVEKKHRSAAKGFSFGLLYGMGDAALAENLGCSVDEAAKVRSAILGKFVRLDSWVNKQLQQARLTGETWTYLDGRRARRRPLWRIADDDSQARGTAERGSWNSPVQGSAADYCLRAVIETTNWLRDDAVDAKLVLTVYDSILIEAAEDYVDEVASTLTHIMTAHKLPGGVPMAADIEVGRSWGSMVPYVGAT